MAMSMTEKASEFKQQADKAVAYIRMCADKHIVPLTWDADLMANDIERIRREKVKPCASTCRFRRGTNQTSRTGNQTRTFTTS